MLFVLCDNRGNSAFVRLVSTPGSANKITTRAKSAARYKLKFRGFFGGEVVCSVVYDIRSPHALIVCRNYVKGGGQDILHPCLVLLLACCRIYIKGSKDQRATINNDMASKMSSWVRLDSWPQAGRVRAIEPRKTTKKNGVPGHEKQFVGQSGRPDPGRSLPQFASEGSQRAGRLIAKKSQNWPEGAEVKQ